MNKNIKQPPPELDLENIIKEKSKKSPRAVYSLVLIVFIILQIINFFSVSNIFEFALAVVSIVLIFIFSAIPGKVGKCISNVYLVCLVLCLLVSAIMQKPFLGAFSTEKLENSFYVSFAEGMYEYSTGNFEDSLSIFKNIKWCVPNEDLTNYYMWYIDAATCAKDYELADQLSDEMTNKITSTNAKERDAIFKSLPVSNMVKYVNEGDSNKILETIRQYRNTREKIFILFEIAAHTMKPEKTLDDWNIVENLMSEYSIVPDSFENYHYVKVNLLNYIYYTIKDERPDLAAIILSEYYALDKAAFFKSYLWHFSQQNNYSNVRWISLDYLYTMKLVFTRGWDEIKDSDNPLFYVYKQNLINLGLFLGEIEVIKSLNFDDKTFSSGKEQINQLLKTYSDRAAIYNLLKLSPTQYLVVVLEDELKMTSGDYYVKMATRADFYILNFQDIVSISPLAIDGEHLKLSVDMNKLFFVDTTSVPQKLFVTQIAGTGEYLSLQVLNLNTFTSTAYFSENSYHCDSFKYNKDTSTCTWNYEIDNGYDPNMQVKTGGKSTLTIDFDLETFDLTSTFPDPALQFYIEERNDQLIFPLANLNRLAGREIRDEKLLQAIRNNSIPYYCYSRIQETYTYMSDIYINDISGVMIWYRDDEGARDTAYFFLVKKVEDDIKLLGIFEIKDHVFRSVY